jgi:hypothetical protein
MAFGVAAAISLGLVSASLVLAGEAAFGLLLVGWLFERLDLSAETNA